MFEQLHQYLQVLQQERKLSKNSYQSYERDLLKFTGFLEAEGVSSWANVHKHHIMKYMQSLKEVQFKSATIARHTVSIKALFHYFMVNDMLSFDPTIYVEAPKQEKKLPQIISQEETNALLQAPETDQPYGLRDKAMLELLYATGIRVSELVNLNIDQINLSLGFIQCISPSLKERIVPFGQFAKDALEQYLQNGRPHLITDRTETNETEAAVFLNHLGSRMTRQGFWKLLKKYAQDVGIGNEITPQTLRHSVASHLLENGADVRAVQELLGHVDITTTMKYTSIPKQMMKEIYSHSHPRA